MVKILIVFIIIAGVILIHLFKVRYLDYYNKVKNTKENNESSNTITENIVQEENNKDNYEFPNIDLDNKKDDVILSSDKTIDNEGFWPVKDIDISVLGIDNLE